MCKVRDMLCHAYVSELMNRKVYWDLSFCFEKNPCARRLKYGVCAFKIRFLIGFDRVTLATLPGLE